MNIDEVIAWCDNEIAAADEFLAVFEENRTDELAFIAACTIGRVETLKQLKGDILGDGSYS